MSTYTAPDTDTLAARRPIDNEADKATAKKLQLGEGWYTTIPSMGRRQFIADDGRRTEQFRGKIVGDNGETGLGTLKLSSEERLSPKTGKPDLQSQLYLQAKAVYQKAYGTPPAYVEDVYDYVEQYPIRVRIINGSNGELVVQVSNVRA